MNRSHLVAIRDTVMSTALFGVAFYFLHWRAKAEVIGLHDGVIVIGLIVAGLAIGYRDRVSLVAGNVGKVWSKKGS